MFAGCAFCGYLQAAQPTDGGSSLGDFALFKIDDPQAGVAGVAAQSSGEFGEGEGPRAGVSD